MIEFHIDKKRKICIMYLGDIFLKYLKDKIKTSYPISIGCLKFEKYLLSCNVIRGEKDSTTIFMNRHSKNKTTFLLREKEMKSLIKSIKSKSTLEALIKLRKELEVA